MKWTWRLLALPGVAWLTVFFLLALYAVLCVAFGNQNTLSEPVPFWNPLDWNVGYVAEVLRDIWERGQFYTVFVRTFFFVVIAVFLSLLIGYPVAYFAARHAGRWKGLVLVLLVIPFWINYLMRMLAWVNLLSPDGWGTRFLHTIGIERLFVELGLLSDSGDWLDGQASTVIIALVYGYVPFLVLPLVRLARPHRRAADRSRTRPRREPGKRILPGDAPALEARDPRRDGAHRAADVRRLLHARHRLGLTQDEHDRQPDRPAHPTGVGEGCRVGADDAPRARAARTDGVLPPGHTRRRLGREA